MDNAFESLKIVINSQIKLFKQVIHKGAKYNAKEIYYFSILTYYDYTGLFGTSNEAVP